MSDQIDRGHRPTSTSEYCCLAKALTAAEQRAREYQEKWQAAQATLAALREALAVYGVHQSGCPQQHPPDCSCYEIVGGHQPGCQFYRVVTKDVPAVIKAWEEAHPCNCGLAATLASDGREGTRTKPPSPGSEYWK